MRISLIEPADFQEINKLIIEEFPYTEKKQVKAGQRIKEKNVFIFKASNEGKLAGFIDCAYNKGTGKIFGLVVVKEFRGKGLGKDLAKYAVEFLRSMGATEIRLLVREKNLSAKKIYREAGFVKEQGFRKKIGNEDIEEMVLLIKRNNSTPDVS